MNILLYSDQILCVCSSIFYILERLIVAEVCSIVLYSLTVYNNRLDSDVMVINL